MTETNLALPLLTAASPPSSNACGFAAIETSDGNVILNTQAPAPVSESVGVARDHLLDGKVFVVGFVSGIFACFLMSIVAMAFDRRAKRKRQKYTLGDLVTRKRSAGNRHRDLKPDNPPCPSLSPVEGVACQKSGGHPLAHAAQVDSGRVEIWT